MVDGLQSPGILRWRAILNSNGTYTICDKADVSKKLIERTNLSGINKYSRYTGQRPTINRSLYIDTSSSSSQNIRGQVGVINQWYLRLIESDKYWLVNPNRTDSGIIRLLASNKVPVFNIDWAFATLSGWVKSEGTAASNAFTGQPSGINRIPFYTSPVVPNMPLGGTYWNNIEEQFFAFPTRITTTTLINTSRPGNDKWASPQDALTGTLTSMPFLASSSKINFNIGGTENAANIKVEVLKKVTGAATAGDIGFSDGSYRVAYSATGHNNDITRQVSVTVSELYTIYRIRITDNIINGHILVGNINFDTRGTNAAAPANPVIPLQKPIWGAIDMHTHPVAYLGMGGKLMHGQLDGDPRIALGSCKETHGGWGLDNIKGNYIRAEVVNMVDEHDEKRFRRKVEDFRVPHKDHEHEGYPALLNWPKQSSMIHQQMWYEWLQRANQGGLKAIIALTVNSELLAIALEGKGPTAADPSINDKETANRQIAEIIAFAGRHPDFLGIARNPAEMRTIINSGRMAIIIGMEIDNIGNFYANTPVSQDQIRAEITRLKSLGVSYIFPIHIVDNKFGGAAAYKDFFNFSNKYSTGKHILGNRPAKDYPLLLPGNLMRVEEAGDRKIGFRFQPMLSNTDIVGLRTLTEFIETAPANPLLIPLFGPVMPILIELTSSNQFQTLKKYFLDLNPETTAYNTITKGHRNILGLTAEGDFAIKEMMRQGIMIDVDHASEKAVDNIIVIANRNNYPVNSGHNSLRGNNDNEKTRTRVQLDAISRLGGMFGIGWENQSPDMFNSIYSTHLAAMGNKNTTFGSDIDGYAATTKKVSPPVGRRSTIPGEPNIISRLEATNYENRKIKYGIRPGELRLCTMEGSPKRWDYNNEGMAHIGLVPDFFEALKKDGMSLEKLNQLFLSAEYFAQMWEKCIARAPLVER
jgi:microsomal dipeptidase-like Zn-dependent dipeptidase